MRYKFREVLVADTRLVWPEVKWEPQVLALNERLNECHELGKTCDSLAATCCVHLERPEFARRRRRRADEDCFASCAKRRPVDIELAPVEQQTADGGKLGGKIVILALSRLQQPTTGDGADPNERPGAEYRCQRAWSRRFGRFEPSQASWQARLNQTFYARLAAAELASQDEQQNDDDNRWPPLQVDQLNITWNSSTGRELVSMLVGPPPPTFAKFRRETLVSTELVCSHNTNRTARIHLLTLLNRRPRHLPSSANFRPPETKANASRRAIVSPSTTSANIEGGSGTGTTLTATSPLTTGGAPHPASGRASGLQWAELLWENLRGQLMQRSQVGNGLLHLALGSLFVILIYTSCLLCLYLRGCRRRRTGITTASKPRRCKRDALNISRPFNLQMPPATKTRLEMMMGVSERGREAASADGGRATRAPSALQRRPSAKRMVRAIRRAATSRFSRRRRGPSQLLNVIPESSECSLSFEEPHFDELVQQALSLQCAHLRLNNDRMKPPRHRQPPTRTLFSRRPHLLAPNGHLRATAAVSRNRILKQVKQDNLYE